LQIHYIASIPFIALAFFHLVYHGIRGDRGLIPQKGDLHASIDVIKSFFGKGEEPPFQKYLPEQRLAYVGMAAIIAMLILSGLIKTFKNVYAPDMPLAIVLTATWIHNIFFILFILAFLGHIGAIALKPNRPMVRESSQAPFDSITPGAVIPCGWRRSSGKEGVNQRGKKISCLF
jgi:cytochrome b subunit of formate dehydrogenase